MDMFDLSLFNHIEEHVYVLNREDEKGNISSCMAITGEFSDDVLEVYAGKIDCLISMPSSSISAGAASSLVEQSTYVNAEKGVELQQFYERKSILLKRGCFCVEFLPEENADNYEYIYKVKDMARKAGLEYYAAVPWVKTGFVANTGRKSKNSETVVLFSKGKARALRVDAQKNKKEQLVPENIFECGTQVIVNPVNLKGVMGKGLALQFKEKYPEMFEAYRAACKDGSLQEGKLHLYKADDVWILNFPTKRDWRDPSDIRLIEKGLQELKEKYKEWGITSAAFPRLGCGLGGLDWNVVGPLMHQYLDGLDIDVKICGEKEREHYMSGTAGMLPCVFDVPPVRRGEKIHQAEKPVELLEQILRFVTKENELVLDQFAGSGATGVASLNTGRNCILIEKDLERFERMTQRLETLGSIEAVSPAANTLLSLGADAIVARDAFMRSGDRDIIYDFVKKYKMPEPAVLYQGEKDLWHKGHLTEEQKEAVSEAFNAIEDIDLRSEDLDLDTIAIDVERESKGNVNGVVPEKENPKVLECSSRGDRRFSALFAQVTIKGKTQSIEEWYQGSKRDLDGKRVGKGKPFAYIVDPFTGDRLSGKEATSLYRGLWITYLSKNPELVKYAEQFDEFHDMFKGKNTVNCQADVIAAYVKGDRDGFVASVRASDWYKNMAHKMKGKKSLEEQIQDAKGKRPPEGLDLETGMGKQVHECLR